MLIDIGKFVISHNFSKNESSEKFIYRGAGVLLVNNNQIVSVNEFYESIDGNEFKRQKVFQIILSDGQIFKIKGDSFEVNYDSGEFISKK